MRFIDHGGQLVIGKFQGVVAAHDLDQVCAAAYLLTHSAPDLVRPAGFAATPIRMAARLDDGLAGDQQAWAREDTLFDRLFGIDVGPVHAQIAHQRHARAQALEHVGGSFVGADLRRIVH